MLDLSTPAHREALRWACVKRRDESRTARLLLDFATETREPGARVTALRALSSPTESAAIVRALLERCGVDVERLSPRPMQRARGAGPYVDIVGWDADDEKWQGADMANVPALVLRSLDIKTPRTDVETGVRIESAVEYACECNGCGGWSRNPDDICPTCGREEALAALREVGR